MDFNYAGHLVDTIEELNKMIECSDEHNPGFYDEKSSKKRQLKQELKALLEEVDSL